MLIKYDPKIQQARRNSRSLIVTSVVFTVIVILVISPLSNPGFLPSITLAARGTTADAASLSPAQMPKVLVATVEQAPTRMSIDTPSPITQTASTLDATPISVQSAPTLIVLTPTPAMTVTVAISIAMQTVLTPTNTATLELTPTAVTLVLTALAATPTPSAAAGTEPAPLPIELAATPFPAVATAQQAPTQLVSTEPPPTETAPPLLLVPTPTPTEPPPAVVGSVQLLEPAVDTVSHQHKVDFTWQIVEPPLAADQCAELVFWDPNQPGDQRSPVGAGKEAVKRVAFDFLTSSADPLLRTLAQSRRALQWGVRIVSCTEPQVVLRAVEEVRAYTY